MITRRVACSIGISVLLFSARAFPDAPAEKAVALSLHAGAYDRLDVPVSVLIDADHAQSVWVEFPDGSLSRSQLVEPGLLDAGSRGTAHKELFFGVSKLAKGHTLTAIAKLSEQPVEGRRYAWSGEPNQSRRLSCPQCHQGLSPPTAAELRAERELLKRTGKVPPLVLPRLLPTAKGEDYRWHKKLGRYETSACWDCHGRHMVQYEFGTPARSAWHQLFRTAGDRKFDETTGAGSPPAGCGGLVYGFSRATVRAGAAAAEEFSSLVQQHAGTISEEAGKFVGRHNVLIHWTGARGGDARQRAVLAHEERQLTVKNTRARNGSRANWIDFVSKLTSLRGTLLLDGAEPTGGIRFVPPTDPGAELDFRESTAWRAITFVLDGTTYTVACFNQPRNPQPLGCDRPTRSVGYRFSATTGESGSLLVHYRLWLQEGKMPAEELDAMSADFLQPIRIEVK